MKYFQLLALAVLGTLVLREVIGLRRRSASRVVALARCLVWLATAAAIACPDAITLVANSLGIGRGADLVMYLFVLAFLGVSFYFYSRYVKLQRQVTQLVRHIAIQDARRAEVSANP